MIRVHNAIIHYSEMFIGGNLQITVGQKTRLYCIVQSTYDKTDLCSSLAWKGFNNWRYILQ